MGKDLNYTLSLKDLFSKQMRGASEETDKLDNKMSGLGSKLASIGAVVGISALGREMVTTGAKFDSYKLQLETLLGSQIAASSAFENIKRDAEKTPFDVDSLTRANAMLISAGAGANEARNMVMNLGNAIASTGGGSDELSRMAVNLQQIKTLGKASAMDVKQFAFANIPIYQMLAKTTGKTIEQVREMDVTYEQLGAAFEKAGMKGGMFAGGLEKQSKGVAGQLSNLGDKWTNTLVTFYDRLKPVIIQVIGLLSDVLTWVVKNKETLFFLGRVALLIGSIVGAVWLWNTAVIALRGAQLALNMVMAANPIALVVLAVAGLVFMINELINQYSELARMQREAIGKNINTGFADEQKQLDFLISKYEKLGYTKELAQKKAIASAKATLFADYAEVKKLGTSLSFDPASDLRVKQRRMAELGGRMAAITDLENKGLSSTTTTKNGGGLGKGGDLGTGVNLSANRPQSLVINITELVHELKIQANDLKDSTIKIKEEVSKIFLEMVNDANLATR